MRETLVATLAALGIALPVEAYFSGLFLALAGGYLMTIFVPEKQPVELRWMLAVALFVATCLAIGHAAFMPELPVQLKMAVGGALSRWIVRIVANRAAARAQEIVQPAPPEGEPQ